MGKRTSIILGMLILILALPLAITLSQRLQVWRQQAATTSFSAIHVSGNKLVNTQGQQIVLHGVNRSGTEYGCVQSGSIFDGPSDAASIQAIASWNVNVVRVPLNEDCWLGINGAAPGGLAYQQAITNYVNLINQNNMYVILDLHWNAPATTKATGQQVMADKDHSTAFWAGVAQTFKGNNEVIFDLYNEPQSIGWSCWKDGTGCATPFPVASMQDMITAVRTAGATNVLMLGGLSYSNDLSGWLANKPTDPNNNIAASWHMYGKNSCSNATCWDSTVAPVIAQVPVIAGEFGESYDGSICGTTTSNAFMTWMDQHNSSYVAWVWNTWGTSCGNLALISDYAGTPKSPNGTNYKAHLLSLSGSITLPTTTPLIPTPTFVPTPTIVHPTFMCLGACPTTQPSSTPILTQSATQTVSPTPSQILSPTIPCATSTHQSITAVHHSRHLNRSGGGVGNGLLADFLNLIKQLLALIMQLLSGTTPPSTGNTTVTPTPSLTVSQTPMPSITPSAAPCPSTTPTTTISMIPSTTSGPTSSVTMIPTTTVQPSITLVPSQTVTPTSSPLPSLSLTPTLSPTIAQATATPFLTLNPSTPSTSSGPTVSTSPSSGPTVNPSATPTGIPGNSGNTLQDLIKMLLNLIEKILQFFQSLF